MRQTEDVRELIIQPPQKNPTNGSWWIRSSPAYQGDAQQDEAFEEPGSVLSGGRHIL